MIFTLIGMPGSGKSCLGRAIAGKLKMKHVDTDRLIERRYGKKLSELIAEYGNEGFSKIEEETLLSIDEDNILLSTGGSAVYSEAAMEYLRSRGKLIYLYCGHRILSERLGDLSRRGVVMKEGMTLRDLFEERAPLYSKYADITVICDGHEYPKYQRAVIAAIKKHKEGGVK